MQIRCTKKIQSEVSLQDPIGVDKEGNELPSIGYLQLYDVVFSGIVGYMKRSKLSFLWLLSLKYTA